METEFSQSPCFNTLDYPVVVSNGVTDYLPESPSIATTIPTYVPGPWLSETFIT